MKEFLETVLKEDVQDFIREHENADVQKLLLKQKLVCGAPAEWVAQQITGRRRIKIKLPTWYNTMGIVYPLSVHLEQSSSEATAKFKLNIIRQLHPNQGIVCGVDLTGGFGVDAYFLSKGFRQFDYVEPNKELLEIVRNNHRQLGATNITYHHASAEEFLNHATEKFQVLFIDPSRRKASRKVYKLAESEPDVVKLRSVF